jgi:hypothetical protein
MTTLIKSMFIIICIAITLSACSNEKPKKVIRNLPWLKDAAGIFRKIC